MKTNKIKLEIRAAEGGEDAKLLVNDMATVYQKAASINSFTCSIEHWIPGYVSMWLTGQNVKEFFNNEIGGHRFQRVPPTEKRGRVQTSTITVAVMDEDTKPKFILNRDEVERKYCRSGGKGGQKVNKTESCVILIHKPTGIIVRSEENRTQAKNEDAGWKRLEEKLSEIQNGKDGAEVKEARFNQIGYGNRNDKRRTYREQDGYVLDHITGKRISIKDLYKGKVKDLHKSN